MREQEWLRGETENGTTIDLAFDDQFNRSASLEKISGVWFMSEGEYASSITIDSDGSFFGDSTDGCQYSGEIDIPDAEKNIYRMAMTATGCAHAAGSYEGHAMLLDHLGTEDRLAYGLVSSGYVIVNQFSRED
ncbi:hypothetical protein [Alkalilimnicola ehrlichii]|uniref:hypothetical protein n=1 Tax=Alkalilimnicola ehrlichii TaxID=351052 RepID=UPI0011C02888|nr:hypothetical protein [Alkalilimnicola ehrlichii]